MVVWGVSIWLLGHVEQNQALIFFRECGSNAHVPKHRYHHPWRILLWGSMTATTICVKALFASDPHVVGVACADDWIG